MFKPLVQPNDKTLEHKNNQFLYYLWINEHHCCKAGLLTCNAKIVGIGENFFEQSTPLFRDLSYFIFAISRKNLAKIEIKNTKKNPKRKTFSDER